MGTRGGETQDTENTDLTPACETIYVLKKERKKRRHTSSVRTELIH